MTSPMRQMKFVLNLYGPTGASLCVESDCIDDIANAYVSVQRLTARGVLPLLQLPPVNFPGTPERADNG